MGSTFKETILKLLSATSYSLDNLSKDEISSFENLQHLKPLFEWISQNISEANCVTPQELEEFRKLQETSSVKCGDELDEALQAYLCKDRDSPVPFKESLNDAEQELTLLREQLHYKEVLHKNLCSSNASKAKEICELKRELQKAEVEQKETIKEICAANKKLKDKIDEVQANVNELHDDIIGLAQKTGSPEVSVDEGIHTLTSDNLDVTKSSASVWSHATGSSWQTIKSMDSDHKYVCQLSFEEYQKVHKQFLKRLTKLIDNLSKVGTLLNNSEEHIELYMIKERLEKQMIALIENEAEIEGIQAARMKVKELKRATESGECLLSRLKYEESNLESEDEDDSINLDSREDLAVVCQQWADLQVLRAVEFKQRERLDFGKQIIKKMDEVLCPLLLKLKADKILSGVLEYEKERIEASINLYKSFYLSLQNQYDRMKENIRKMQNNLQDYEKFCAMPLEDRNELVELLASIILSDNEGVVKAVQNLKESSRREHETMFEHYVQEKNKLITSGNNLEESSNMIISRSTSCDGVPSELVGSIQQDLDQLDSGIEEVNLNIHEVIYNIAEEKKEH